MKILRLTALLLLSSLTFGQVKVTVTGQVQDTTGVSATSGYVQFQLQPYSSSVWYYVQGTTTIVAQTMQCGIDGSGNIKDIPLTGPCLVWGNDVITPANTLYQVTFAPASIPTNVINNVLITGSTFNANSPTFGTVLQLVPQYQTITTSPIQANLVPAVAHALNVGNSGFPYAAGYFDNLFVTSWNITGGTINGTPIGGVTPSTGAFTTLVIGGGTALTTSNKTGSGNIVLATSPTIATPTITGHPTIESVTPTGATGTGTMVFGTGPTISSPVITGTPSGAGIPTVTMKKGTGAGNYSNASTTYVRVDSTNLAYTVTIPTGWKLLINATGTAGVKTGAVAVNVALADGVADNTGILTSLTISPAVVSDNWGPFAMTYVVTGDGASHTINLQYLTSAGADSVVVTNTSAASAPVMTFLLTPSN